MLWVPKHIRQQSWFLHTSSELDFLSFDLSIFMFSFYVQYSLMYSFIYYSYSEAGI